METKNNKELTKAMQIGIVCVCSYMISYYMRNILSVTSPEMTNCQVFTKKFLGLLSSTYMLTYAVGQLINGVMGDIIKPKYMVCGGMLMCGISSIAFAFSHHSFIQIALFALIGFSLSMLRGPLVKTISENTKSNYSCIICTFFSFAGFIGPLIASLLSIIFNWQKTFVVAGAIAIIIGISVLIIFSAFEKSGKITYKEGGKSEGFKNIFRVFSLKHFVFYTAVGAIAEISSASIDFWTPTYFAEQLCISANTAKLIFSITSIAKGGVPFATLLIFRMLNGQSIRIIRFSFSVATVFFIGMRLISFPAANILFLLLAQMAIGCASSLLWSIYIPSQGESGMVSTINGVLDFSGYLFAALANILFANVIGLLGWGGIITLWIIMAFIGVAVSVLTKERKLKFVK